MLSLLFGCLAWVARFALGQLSTHSAPSIWSAESPEADMDALASNSTSTTSIEKEPGMPLSLISDAAAEKKRAPP